MPGRRHTACYDSDLLSSSALTAGPLSAQTTQLPSDLAAIATSIGCGPVPGFFDRPGRIDPPYIYGYRPGDRENSAAFWCYRQQDQTHLLVFVREGRAVARIPWSSLPGGLTLADEARLDLSQFRYVDDPQARGPSNVTTDYRPLVSECDGVSYTFYEYRGRWLVWFRH